MSGIVALADADEEAVYGAKAVGLGDALRAGLPVPPGVALPGPEVGDIATGRAGATAALRDAVRALPTPLAVRSSCVDEDSAGASFAGQHLTVLNVPSADDVEGAVRAIWWSANSDSATSRCRRCRRWPTSASGCTATGATSSGPSQVDGSTCCSAGR